MTAKPARTPASTADLSIATSDPDAPVTRTLPTFTPVPRRPRHDGFTPARQRQFIEALADYGSVDAAARGVGITAVTAYQLRRHPQAESFRQAWEAALDLGVQRLEDIAMDRAINGVEVPVYSYGKLVGSRITHNDRLLMFVLRNRASHRFPVGNPAYRPDAVSRARLKKLKEQWRAEWLAEQNDPAEIARIRASIETRLLQLRDQAIRSRAAAQARPQPPEPDDTTDEG